MYAKSSSHEPFAPLEAHSGFRCHPSEPRTRWHLHGFPFHICRLGLVSPAIAEASAKKFQGGWGLDWMAMLVDMLQAARPV